MSDVEWTVENPENKGSQVEIPEVLPLLPIRDIVIYPYMMLPLFVGRDVSIRAVEEALSRDRLIFLVSQINSAEENPGPADIHRVGTIASIMRMQARRVSGQEFQAALDWRTGYAQTIYNAEDATLGNIRGEVRLWWYGFGGSLFYGQKF